MEKKDIREKALEMRRSLTSKDIDEASWAVFDTLVGMDAVKNAKHVMVYSNFDNEVKTAKLTGWLLYNGKSVYLPTVEGKKMYALNIRNAVLELSGFGVAQPKMGSSESVDPAILDLIVVPGVAYDLEKNRLGFGFGYYDAFLKTAAQAKTIAVAYDFQVFPHVPAQDHDVKVDCIVTPDRVIE